MGAETYDNKSLSTIQTDVEKEFKAIENREEGLFKGWYRDDQQIYDAGINVIDRYINQLATAKSMWVSNEKWGVNEGKAKLIKSENIFKEEALTYFRQEKIHFQQRWNEVLKEKNILGTGAYITRPSENKVQINEVASAIDTAEEDALKKIMLVCNPKQENVNAEEQSSVVRDKQGNVKVNNGEIVRQEPMFHTDKKTGVMTFTKRCNPLRIDQALAGLFTKDDIDYEIDYTNCTDPKVKQKMMEFTGGEAKCLIKKDKEKGTYLIRNKKGKTEENRALIWEGVTLKRDEFKQWEAREKKKAQNAQLGHIDAKIDDPMTPENDPELQKFVEKIPEALRDKLRALGNTEYRRFIIEHENRLNVILKKGKAENYEIETEPVSEELFGLLEVHFVSGYAEMDISVRKDKSVLGNNLYNLLYNNINDYKTYLTKRVSEKRLEFEDLTQVEEINVNKRENEEGIDKEGKKQILYGLYLLDKLVDNYRNSEGDSWADDDDKDLAAITKIIRDARFSIGNADNIGQQAIIENIINPIWAKWSKIKHIEKMNNTEYGTYENPDYEGQYNQLKNIFFGTKDQQIEGTRNIGTYGRIFDKTETSFLEDEIMATEIKQNEDGTVTITGGLEINNSDLNKCFQKIKTGLFVDLQYDTTSGDLIENQTTKLIDDLYDAASSDTSGGKIIDILVNNGMIPSEWKNNSDVKEKTKELAKILNKQVEVIESFTIENIRTSEEKERLELEMKSDKTEDDMERLQALNYMKGHPEEANDMYEKTLQKTKDELKYGGINDIVCKALVSVFVEEGGGAKGDNANIYNDIVGYGFWNLSDSNAKVMGEILVEIAITVAIAVVTGGAGAAAMAAILRSGALAARGARWVNLATKLAKVIEITQKGYKGLKWGGKAIKLGYRATSLLLEGTIFNAASEMVHAAMNGTSLDKLDLNPIARENIQTAAFLGALSVVNKIGGTIIMKIGGKTKINVDWSKGLEYAAKQNPGVWTASLVSELGGMLAVEQGMNFIFGHDIVNPETGEFVTSRSPTIPTQEEWIQMIGMLLAFKMVKPQLWAKYEQQLNDGTLEICRSTKVNEVILRNTKTGEIKKIKDLVDGKYDNYRTTPEQHRLNNQNKWLEKQSQYETEYNESKKIISELPENLRSDAMKKLLNVNDMIELSSNDIKRLQREIGLTGEDVNGVIGPETLEMLKQYTDFKLKEYTDFKEKKEKLVKTLEDKKSNLSESDAKRVDDIIAEIERSQRTWEESISQVQEKLKGNPDKQTFETVFRELMEIYNKELNDINKKIKDTLGKKSYEDIKQDINELYNLKFNQCCKVFNEGMKIFKKEYVDLTSVEPSKKNYDEIYNMEEFIKKQAELLLENSPNMLDKLIAFEGAKKAIQYGRELHDSLNSILEKVNNGIIKENEIAGEIAKLSTAEGFSEKVAETLGFDKGTQWDAKTLEQAINRVDHYMTEYYETIGQVFDPVIENIIWQDAIRSTMETGYYVKKGEGKGEREYSKLTQEQKIERMKAEDKMRNDAIENNNITGELSKYIEQVNKKPDASGNNEKIPENLGTEAMREIKNELSRLENEFRNQGYSTPEVYDLCKVCTDMMLIQTIESQARTMGDHGINHIAGNIIRFDGYVDSRVGSKRSLGEGIDMSKGKLMGHLIMIFHDPGYAAYVSRGSGHFDGSAFHPTSGQKFFDEIIGPLLKGKFSTKEIDLMSRSIGSHDGTTFDWDNPITTFTHMADNMAIGIDKFNLMLTTPEISEYISILGKWEGELDAGKKWVIKKIQEDKRIPESKQNQLISAVEEFTDRSFDNFGFFSIEGGNVLEVGGDGVNTLKYRETQFSSTGGNFVKGLELEAKMRGIDLSKEFEVGDITLTLEDSIKRAQTSTGDYYQDIENVEVLAELLSKPEFEKFGDQITKPRGDYGERYNVRVMVDGKSVDIPKKENKKGKLKVDTNKIKAYLLAGYAVDFVANDGTIGLRVEFDRASGDKGDNTELWTNSYGIEAIVGRTVDVHETYFNERGAHTELDIGTMTSKANEANKLIKLLKEFNNGSGLDLEKISKNSPEKLPRDQNTLNKLRDIKSIEQYRDFILDKLKSLKETINGLDENNVYKKKLYHTIDELHEAVKDGRTTIKNEKGNDIKIEDALDGDFLENILNFVYGHENGNT